MESSLKLTVGLLGLIFVGIVFYLLVKKRINERNTLLWIAGAVAIMLIALVPDILEFMAALLGVDYPPSLLFLVSTLILLVLILYQSIQISLLQDKCRELAQNLAILANCEHQDGQLDELLSRAGQEEANNHSREI